MQGSRMYSRALYSTNPMALYYTTQASSSALVSKQGSAEEVRFLHSLWDQGPPAKRARGENPPILSEEEYNYSSQSEEEDNSYPLSEEEDKRPEFEPLEPWSEKKRLHEANKQGNNSNRQKVEHSVQTLDSPEKNNDFNWNPDSWETEKPSTQAEWTSATQKSEGNLFTEEEERQLADLRLQNKATRAFKDFLSKGRNDESTSSESEDDMDEDDDKDSDCAPSGALAREVSAQDFFDKLFMEDQELRRFYEQNCNCGAFECLVCAAIGAKMGKKFPDCVSLIQHATKIMKTKKKAAHRGFGRAVCTMLGWSADRLPSLTKSSSEIVTRGCIPPPDEVKVQVPEEGDGADKTDSDGKAAASDDSDTNNVEDEEPASDDSDTNNVEDEEPASDDSDTNNVEDEEPASDDSDTNNVEDEEPASDDSDTNNVEDEEPAFG